jgi:preprotein translocase subunit SecG
MSITHLVYRLIAAVLLITFVLLYRSRTTLEGSALLAAVLVLYSSWALGGWQWLLAPATLFASYRWFFPGKAGEVGKHNIYAVTSVAFAGLVWIFVGNLQSKPELLFPYTAGYAMHLSILALTLLAVRGPAKTPWRTGAALVFQCWLLIFLPYVLAVGISRRSLLCSAVALVACALALATFCLLEPHSQKGYSVNPGRWLRQGALVLFVTALIAGAQEFL